MSSEKELEKEIQDKGLNAPRLTPQLIDSVIVDTDYYVFPKTQLTVCCLTLQNGFTVTGESACASPENFNKSSYFQNKYISYINDNMTRWHGEIYVPLDRSDFF